MSDLRLRRAERERDPRRVLAERLRTGRVHAADLYMLGRLQWVDPYAIEDVLGLQLATQATPWETLEVFRRGDTAPHNYRNYMRNYLNHAWVADLRAEVDRGEPIPVERLGRRLRQLHDILSYLDPRITYPVSSRPRYDVYLRQIEDLAYRIAEVISRGESAWYFRREPGDRTEDLWAEVQLHMTRRWAGGEL